MMANTNTNWVAMSDSAIISEIGHYIRNKRIEQNTTQAQLATKAGLNRWTISQIENGESITLSTLIQVLRALDCLYVLNAFDQTTEISPIAYAKLQKKQKKRVRNSNPTVEDNDEDLGW